MSLENCSITRGMAASGTDHRGEDKVRGGAFSRNGGGTILQTLGVFLVLLILCALACLISLFLEKCSRDVLNRGDFYKTPAIASGDVSSPRRSASAANRNASSLARNATARAQSLSFSIGNAPVANPKASAKNQKVLASAGNPSDATGKALVCAESVSNPTGNVSSSIENASDRTGNRFT
jgi:hypothetical protein